MRKTGLLCLMGTTILTCSAGVALAQTATTQTNPTYPATVTHKAAAQRVAAADTPQQGPSGASTDGSLPTDIARQMQQENIVVKGRSPSRNAIGGGLMVRESAPKSVSTVTQAFIEKQAPGSSPFALARLLPGVNVSSPDPLGLTGGNLTMRGLNTSEIGVTLEGLPISDVGSAAAYPQEILDSENMSQLIINQGSANLDSPVVNASGGTFNIYMRDPAMKPGGEAVFSYGQKSEVRGFARLDTGLIGHTNLRGYVSYSHVSTNQWRGPGYGKRQQGDLKFVNDWGQGNRVSLALVVNNGDSNELPTVSLPNWQKYGWGPTNNYTNVYNPKSPSNFIGARINPFTNIYASMPSTFTLTDHLNFTTAPYLWYGYGNGGGEYTQDIGKVQYGAQTLTTTAYGQTKGTYAFYDPSITETYRPGINSKFTYTTGHNKAVVGYWFEYSKQYQTSPYSLVNNNGSPLNQWGDEDILILSNGQQYQYRNTVTLTRINTVYFGDSYSLLNDKLTFDAGMRYQNIARDGSNYLPSVKTPYTKTRNDGFLPTASVHYQINKDNQIFASVTTNMKMPANYNLYEAGSYSTTTKQYSTQPNVDQRPEVSISEEAGYRYQGPLINVSATYFHYNFTNTQRTTMTQDPLRPGSFYTSNINSGGMHSDGVDLEAGTRPWHNLRPYASAQILHSVTDSNVVAANGDYVRSTGKLTPNTPQFSAAFALDYDDGSRFGGFQVAYEGHQYADYMNQTSINGYTTLNMDLGYRFPNVWHLKSPTFTMNFLNLLNEHYLDNTSTIVTNSKATTGISGKSIGAATPYFSIGSGFTWIGTLKTDF